MLLSQHNLTLRQLSGLWWKSQRANVSYIVAERREYVCMYDILIVWWWMSFCAILWKCQSFTHTNSAQHVHRFCSDRQLLCIALDLLWVVCVQGDRHAAKLVHMYGIWYTLVLWDIQPVETTMSRAQWHRPCVGWGFIIALLSHRHMQSNAIAQVIDVDYLLMLWRRVLKYVKTTMRHFILDRTHHNTPIHLYSVVCIFEVRP